MPDLADLELTVSAASVLHFGEVARTAHVNQSTVSRSIQRVEDAVGRVLFVRRGRNIALAEGSDETIEALRSIVAQWHSITATEESGQARDLAVFCTVTASQTFVPDVLAEFRVAHPDVVLHLRTGPASAAIDAVLDSSADVAIAPLPPKLPGSLVALDLTVTPLVAIATSSTTSWSDPAIVLPRQGLVRDLGQRWCRRHLGRFTMIETESHEEVVALAALGSGIGIVPSLVVEGSALRPRLVLLQPPAPLPEMRIGLCAKRRSVASSPLSELWSVMETTWRTR